MAAFTKDTGEMTCPMVEEDSFIKTEICTMAIGNKTRFMALDSTPIKKEPNSRGTGSMISNMDKVRRHGLMVQYSVATINTARRTDSVSSSGKTNPNTVEASMTIISMASAHINGLINASTVVTGLATKCTVTVSSLGPTEESMMDSTSMTRNMAPVSSLGQIRVIMMAHGSTQSRKD
jgi:hypothetical protein